MRKAFGVLAALAALAVPVLARMDDPSVVINEEHGARILTEVTDEPAWFWMVWWVDAGNLSDVAISNTIQGGIFGRHSDDDHEYRGLPMRRIQTNGDVLEYPKGSGQFYGFAYGLWVGSMYPAKIEPGDTTWAPNVSKAAFYTDLGAMAAPEMSNAGGMLDISNRGMYFSDMTIPEGYGFEGEGGQLFAQPGASPMDYQTLWPFADTSINKYRRAKQMPEVDPANGDIVSHQDTYACAGDWIPAKDASILWIRGMGPYDVWGQGIRVEQRTYAWNYSYNDSYVFFNYKIRNMNDFPLKDVYLSWFMDNDVGTGGQGPGDDGHWDDLIGFDNELNMGYTYDANGAEEGWVTPAGYVGAIMLETPGNKGLTGFETWYNGFEIDADGTDELKYQYMSSTEFVTWDNPNDVRMLMNTGPYPMLEPGEEINITIAVIVAYSLDELKEKAQTAKIQFENGYFGFSPPPNPQLTVTPGDSVVYLTWSSTPENFVDPMTNEKTFEGYRVYRSLSGLSDSWQLLADYDLKGSYLPDTVVAEHTVGPTKSSIEFAGFHPSILVPKENLGYTDNTYTITFDTDTTYVVYDVDDQKVLLYNENALAEGGYCVLNRINGTAQPLPGAEYATGTVTFTGAESTYIPLNFKVATDSTDPIHGYVEFVTTESDTIDSTGTLDLEVQAVLTGASGNVYAGAIKVIVDDTIPGLTSVTNEEPITGGQDGMHFYPYHSGDVIFIDGFQCVISDGEYDPEDEGAILSPQKNEQFLIKTYASTQLGSQNGIRHYYIDEDVRNGQIYYYSVTSYSRAQPTEDVEELEGGKSGTTYWAIPRSNPLGWKDASAGSVERVAGTGSALVIDSIISPDEVVGHTYEVGFRGDTVVDTIVGVAGDTVVDTAEVIRYAYFKDVTLDEIVLDSFVVRAGELSGPIIDGVLIQVAAIGVDTLDVESQIDSLQTGWISRPSGTDMDVAVDWSRGAAGAIPEFLVEPTTVDFLITVEPSLDSLGKEGPITVTNYNDPSDGKVNYLWLHHNRDEIVGGSKFDIFYGGKKAYTVTFVDTVTEIVVDTVNNDTTVIDSVIPPAAGDELLIKSMKSTTTEDLFRFETYRVDISQEDTTYNLDKIRVVPNPYYVRAPWDRSQYDRHIYFQYLPLKCTIRIFNSAGLLIRTIEHDGEGLGENAGSEEWNLRTDEDLDCTSGLYIWQVETEDGEKAWGKFAIIR